MNNNLIKSASAILYGEYHSVEDRDRVEGLIREHHKLQPFDFILSEELGPHVYLTPEELTKGMENKMYGISDRTFALCLELGLPGIGIDVWNKAIHRRDRYNAAGEFTDCQYSFALRETRMVEVIGKYKKKGRCAVLVGDTHLRQTGNEVVGGPSYLWEVYRTDRKVVFVRSPLAELL